MNHVSPSPSPAPTQAEPHPVARLEACVSALLGVILGAWWWVLVPGGRAMQTLLRRDGAAFLAVLWGMVAGDLASLAVDRLGRRPPPTPPSNPGGGKGELEAQGHWSSVCRAWRRAVGEDIETGEDEEWVLVRVACGAWPIRAVAMGVAYPAPEPAVPWPR